MFERVKSYFKRNDIDPDLNDKIAYLEKIIDADIDDPSLFIQALRHRSILADENYSPEDSYERLEFLGDAVLDLIVTEIIFDLYPSANEGFLTKLRAKLVKGEALAKYANKLDLGSALVIGERAQGQGIQYSKSILADAFESIIGAIYIEMGYNKSFEFVDNIIRKYVNFDNLITTLDNYKSILLEYTQAHQLEIPQYEVISETGPGHDKTFEIRVLVKDEEMGKGMGKSKKKAEQKAAKNALVKLNPEEFK